jgi:hypothetical protein
MVGALELFRAAGIFEANDAHETSQLGNLDRQERVGVSHFIMNIIVLLACARHHIEDCLTGPDTGWLNEAARCHW